MTLKSDFQYLVKFESPRLGYGKVIIDNTLNAGIPEGVTVILGRNGSGKTTLATALEKGRYAYGNRLNFLRDDMKVKMLSFSDIHSLSGMEVEYLAQRMEATMNDYVPTVGKVLGNRILSQAFKGLCETLAIEDIADKKINFLSSGELRKLLIINALLDDPDLLILDNPYIGLDADSRIELDKAFLKLKGEGKGIVLVLCDPADIPAFTDSVILLDDCKISGVISDKERINDLRQMEPESLVISPALIPPRPPHSPMPHEISFEIRNGHIRYGDRQIFQGVDWKVIKGERWVLTGRNGSGKSLLLSMVCADNPQGYANDIILFDRKRGTGESIWEIKDAIGYVSPEMQLFFRSNSTVREIVMQGLRNSLSRYRPSTAAELQEADKWLALLGITHLSGRLFSQLSSGEQRLVLVARAMIKQPELLVLDEPLHGLDPASKDRIKEIINFLVERNGTSLIFVTHYPAEIPKIVDHTFNLG